MGRPMYSYVKISDKAGNATCFGSDGAIFDLMAPAINGIKNGATYYVTQSVTVTDGNLDSVTPTPSITTMCRLDFLCINAQKIRLKRQLYAAL